MTHGPSPSAIAEPAPAASAPAVSVIVAAHNAAAELRSLLEALDRQTLPAGVIELIVVDDASDDDTAEVVRGSELATLVTAPARGGAYVARNLGVEAAQADVLAFTDSDCVPAADWVERGLAALQDRDADLVAGHIEMPLGPRPSASALIDFARHLDQERMVSDGFGATANLWVRREVFAGTGPFNSKLRSGGDAEFCHRAIARGAKLVYDPRVVVTHPPRSRPRELARKGFRLGFGAAQQLHHAEGPLRNRPHICLHPRAYLPLWRSGSIKLLQEQEYVPTRRDLFALQVTEYCFARLPVVAGNIAGTIAEGWPPRRRDR